MKAFKELIYRWKEHTMPNTNYFKLLNEQLSSAEELSKQKDAKGFLGQEILRFHSIAGTLLDNVKPDGQFSLDDSASVDERYITQPLIRSILENYFKIIYIFDVRELERERFEKTVNGFKDDYRKLFNALKKPGWEKFMNEYGSTLQSANDGWSDLPKLKNINDLLVEMDKFSDYKIQHLYALFRMSSFDIHGNSLKVFFDVAFDTECNFPIINIKDVIEMIAYTYDALLNEHKLSA